MGAYILWGQLTHCPPQFRRLWEGMDNVYIHKTAGTQASVRSYPTKLVLYTNTSFNFMYTPLFGVVVLQFRADISHAGYCTASMSHRSVTQYFGLLICPLRSFGYSRKHFKYLTNLPFIWTQWILQCENLWHIHPLVGYNMLLQICIAFEDVLLKTSVLH